MRDVLWLSVAVGSLPDVIASVPSLYCTFCRLVSRLDVPMVLLLLMHLMSCTISE